MPGRVTPKSAGRSCRRDKGGDGHDGADDDGAEGVVDDNEAGPVGEEHGEEGREGQQRGPRTMWGNLIFERITEGGEGGCLPRWRRTGREMKRGGGQKEMINARTNPVIR